MIFSEFCIRYGMTEDALYMRVRNGEKLLFKIDGVWYADDKAMERRLRFKKKIWLKSHDYYYDLITYFKNDNRYAAYLAEKTGYATGSWGDFIRSVLFCVQSDSVLSYKITDRLWLFYRLSRELVRKRNRNLPEGVSVSLDNYDELTRINTLYLSA